VCDGRSFQGPAVTHNSKVIKNIPPFPISADIPLMVLRVLLNSVLAYLSACFLVLSPLAAEQLIKQRSADGTMTFSDAPINKNGQRVAYVSTYGRPTATASCRGQSHESLASRQKALQAEFEHASRASGLDVTLLTAVARIESCFDPKAVSVAGAKGVMQLMPGTAKELGVRNIFDAKSNITGGATYLSKMLKLHKGNIKLALASYNAGPGAVAKHGGIPPYPETQSYVARVTKQLARNQGNATSN